MPVLAETDPNQEWPSFDSRLTETATLQDHLAWQIRLSDFSEKEKEIGSCILGNLDKDGYLDATIEEIAQMSEADESRSKKSLKEFRTSTLSALPQGT